jgi:transposase
MIGSTRAVRVWAYPAPCDLRKGYNGLFGLVSGALERDPLGGDFFLFCNRRRTSCKVLLYDGTGLCIYMKRLERGRFAKLWGRDERTDAIERTSTELALFIEGCTLVGKQQLSPPPVSARPVDPRSRL